MRSGRSMILALVVMLTAIFLGNAIMKVISSFGGR